MVEADRAPAPKRGRRSRGAAAEENEMDGEIWKHLPDEVLEGGIITPSLPIDAICKFRSVCEKWKAFLDSPIFLRELAEAAPEKQPWFLAKDCGLGSEVGALYDPSMKKWHHPTYVPPCLPYRFSAYSFGGLVCWLNYDHSSFNVGNPLTKIWKELAWTPATKASLEGAGTASIGMVIPNQDHTSKGCKIVLVDTCGRYEVYDSALTQVQVTVARIPPFINLPSSLASTTLSMANSIYFLCTEPPGLMSYNVVTGHWGQGRIPAPPNSRDLALAEGGGRMLMAGFVEDKSVGGPISVRVWEIQTEGVVMWKEVDRMPSSWCSDFSGKADACFKCLGNRRVLVMSLRTVRMNRIFTYDVVTREWFKVPRLVPNDPRRRQGTLTGIGFFPCRSISP